MQLIIEGIRACNTNLTDWLRTLTNMVTGANVWGCVGSAGVGGGLNEDARRVPAD